jgi:hypothetical protein
VQHRRRQFFFVSPHIQHHRARGQGPRPGKRDQPTDRLPIVVNSAPAIEMTYLRSRPLSELLLRYSWVVPSAAKSVYRMYLGEKHRHYHAFRYVSHDRDTEYWNWCHHHLDHD